MDLKIFVTSLRIIKGTGIKFKLHREFDHKILGTIKLLTHLKE